MGEPTFQQRYVKGLCFFNEDSMPASLFHRTAVTSVCCEGALPLSRTPAMISSQSRGLATSIAPSFSFLSFFSEVGWL